jgi:tetratricopeptide (TPR) repeat protein
LAETYYSKSSALSRKLSGDNPDDPGYLDDLAIGLVHLGLVYVETDRPKKAVPLYKEAQNIYQKLKDEHPKVPDYQDQLARVYHNIGHAYEALRESSLAEAAYGEACKMRRQLVRDHPMIPDYQIGLARSLKVLGLLYCGTGRSKEARDLFRDSREIWEKLARDYPEVTDFQVGQGGIYSSLGLLAIQLGEDQTALGWLNRSVKILKAILENEPREFFARSYLKEAYDRRARALCNSRQYAQACQDLDQVQKLEGVKSDAWRMLHAEVLVRMGQYRPAMAEVDELGSRQSLSNTNLYNLACLCSLCSAASRRDTTLSKAEQDRQADQYAVRAIEFLKKAAAAGLFKSAVAVEEMRKDKDLDAVRERQDFQELISMAQPKKKAQAAP